MTDDLVTVATFALPLEAELARQKLESEGVRAVVADDLTVGTLSYVGSALGGVKLLVLESDRAQAEKLLASVPRGDASRTEGAEGTDDWTCPNCAAEVSVDFDVCWRCGSTQDGQKVADFEIDEVESRPDDDTDEPAPDLARAYSQSPAGNPDSVELSRADNPYRAPAALMNVMPSEQALPQGDTSDGDKIAVRAWRAAVLSPFLCPPLLTFYSLWLILRIALSDLELSEAGKSRFYLAMLANVAVWVVVMIIWSYFF